MKPRLILATINNPQKKILESSTADEWLFGQKLNEHFKAAKTIERSGKDLRTKQKIVNKSKNKTPASGRFRNKVYNQNQANKKNWRNQSSSQRNSQLQQRKA